jgi:hypothetical protein
MNLPEKDITDQRIQTEIVDRLTHDPKIDPLKIHVEVKECKVVLRGNVDTEEEKLRVENIAMSVLGVTAVENHLHIGLGIAHALSSLVAQISGESKEDTDKKKPE